MEKSGGFDMSKMSTAEKLMHAVPATLHASLIARLDRIGSIAKEIAQVGAAIGREFSYEFLAATSQRSPSHLKESLTRLVEAGLVFQRGTPPPSDVSVQACSRARCLIFHAGQGCSPEPARAHCRCATGREPY